MICPLKNKNKIISWKRFEQTFSLTQTVYHREKTFTESICAKIFKIFIFYYTHK